MTPKSGKKALHVVSAFSVDNNLVLGQVATDGKSNEITAIPELLKMLVIEGCIVSIDAMGTQKDIASQIIEQKADYVLSLKENQKTLYDDIELYMEKEILLIDKKELEAKGEYYCTIDKEHNRLEKREYYICNNIDWLLQKEDWQGLKGFGICVSSVTTEQRINVEINGKKSYKLEEKTTITKSYAIYSVNDMKAKQFSECKRGHWGIENTLHWSLDMAFREDESRARVDYSAENLNITRHLSYNLLKSEKSAKVGLGIKRLMCGWSDSYLIKVLGLVDTQKN